MATASANGFASFVSEKRTEANFEKWKECLKHYLIGQDLGSVVFGEEEKPQENDSNYKDWVMKNSMALHAIETSCGADTISNLMRKYPDEVDSAKFVWKHLADKPSTIKRYKEEETSSILQYRSLYKAIEKGDWDKTKDCLSGNPNDVRTKISLMGLNALQVAVLAGKLKIVDELVKLMSDEDLEMTSNYDEALRLLKKEGYRQLGFMEDFNRNCAIKLLAKKSSAFLSGSNLGFWNRWLYSCVPNLYQDDISAPEPRDEENVQIPCKQNSSDGRSTRKQVVNLAHGLLWRILKHLVPESIKDMKMRHAQALHLLKLLFKEIPSIRNEELKNLRFNLIVYDAIKNGLVEFIQELITSNPELVWRVDNMGRTLFAYAILLRQEKIFSLIYGLGEKRRTIMTKRDVFGNNFLHLAAKLPPAFQLDRVPGAALQMQKELQWFKEIESMVPTKFKERTNENGHTPNALFAKEHAELMKEGERWMKNTTASCMVVAALIATVVFTTAFTVPGGTNNDTGIPIFLGYDAFLIFIITNALSLFFSNTSVLIFLGILTSRYAEKDFLKSLPQKLIIGLSTLFFSVVTMMIAFGSSIFILLQKRLTWIDIPLTILSAVPIAFYIFFQFPLLFRIVINTHKHSLFDKPKEQLAEENLSELGLDLAADEQS
ncbi:protein ACCELERATED CELL DEATH 6 isoform X2 [Hevea brasiliensis]|uniref:protein ACCELERATED CELL DEATH 6 isoform X2 n=1 Tax=Hevea brasiliensis TaxID=3981 RepID=UPI0025D4E712|nr:protein ACCELERATED CELL DEATH 6 isoform X2 [Hevea brasiliensis]